MIHQQFFCIPFSFEVFESLKLIDFKINWVNIDWLLLHWWLYVILFHLTRHLADLKRIVLKMFPKVKFIYSFVLDLIAAFRPRLSHSRCHYLALMVKPQWFSFNFPLAILSMMAQKRLQNLCFNLFASSCVILIREWGFISTSYLDLDWSQCNLTP